MSRPRPARAREQGRRAGCRAATRRGASLAALVAAAALARTAGADEPAGARGGAPPPPAAVAAQPLAPVVIDGETLFRVRGASSYPAEARARDIEERIRKAARDRDTAPSLTLEERGEGTRILDARGTRVMSVLDEDAAVESVDRRVLAVGYRDRIAEAIRAYRAARQPALLVRHALYALGATFALIFAALAGRRLVRRLELALHARYDRRVHDLDLRTFRIVRAEHVWRFFLGVLRIAWVVGVLAAALVYLRYVLALFPWTRGAGNRLVEITTAPLRAMGRGAVAAVPDLVFLVVLAVVTRYALKLIRLFFDGVGAGTIRLRGFDAEWAQPTYRLVRLLVIAFALVVAYPYVPGSGTEAFKGISIFVGVVLSLGSSSLIGNLIAGYTMTYRRAFRLGDRVRIGEHVGDVEQVRLLVTHLRTPKNEEVVVPNSTILGSEVVNYSSLARERGLILHTTVGIGYETPWRQVEALLLEAARRTPGLLHEPPPFVLQKALGDFAVTYEVNAYCDAPHRMAVLYAELHRNILDVFNEYGVQIMTPAYEGDPDRPKVVPKERWYTAPAERPAAGLEAPGRVLDS
jgi:small-conductance mechanosensitive channel